MRQVFADAQYFVALINSKDQGHATALAISQTLAAATLVTTEDALTEVLTFFSDRGRFLRQLAAAYVDDLLTDPNTIVYPQSHQAFFDGFALFKNRPDKGYSQTDCVSMNVMRQLGITEILTNDDHFAQEGFTKLL